VLETTGIAEPGVILWELEHSAEAARAPVAVSGVVCVADAALGPAGLERREEALAQVRCADRILLSKLDIAAAEQAAGLHRRLTELNPQADRASFPSDEAGTRALVPWLLADRGPAPAAAPPHEHVHRQGQLTAVAIRDEVPLAREPLLALLEELRPRLYRVKGFVCLAGAAAPVFVELAGTELSLRAPPPGAGVAPHSELVLIGEDLDDLELRRRLWACRAGG
jgi:G3E family GTPase